MITSILGREFLIDIAKGDVNLSRSGSFDTGYKGLDDATSGEGR